MDQNINNPGRRTFLKSTAAGTAGLALGGLTKKSSARAQKTGAAGAWQDGKQINPNIDNLRIVLLTDPNFVKEQNVNNFRFDMVNDNIQRDVLHDNLDTMAQHLAQKDNAEEAWATIFQKPPSKEWEDVKAAFKVNCIETKQMVKIATLEKVAIELHRLGVSYENMVVWDGVHNASGDSKYSPYVDDNGLPAGIKVSNGNSLMGDRVNAPVPPPWDGEAKCTGHLVDGTTDILVNFCVNKGHGGSRGSTTLAMKNHFGTFDPSHGHDGSADDQFNYLISINKSEAVLGGEVPRQQLVILDSIFAMQGGPTGDVTDAPMKMLMGTFGPAVDYATVKLIREEEMNRTHTDKAERFLTSFGYSQQEQDDLVSKTPENNDGKGVVQLTSDSEPVQTRIMLQPDFVFLHTIGGKFDSQAVKIRFPSREPITSAHIYEINGNLVRRLRPENIGNRGVVWDGRDGNGNDVRSGHYFIKITGKFNTGAARIVLRK